MVTGLDLSKLFEDKIDNSYSDYVSDAKMQRAFDNAFLRIIENKYRGMDTQKEFDELSELMVIDKRLLINNDRFRTVAVPIASVTTGLLTTTFTFAAEHNLVEGDTFTVSDVTGTGLTGVNETHTVTAVSITSDTIIELATASTGTATANTGSATTQHLSTDSMLPDYLHVLAIKSYMYDTSKDGYSPYKVQAGTPGVVEFFRPNKIRSGDYVHSADLSGTNPQQFIILKRINEFKYEIYDASDRTMNTPIPVTAPTNPSAYVLRPVEENWAKYLQSDRRISQSGKPTVNEPRFNQHKNFILMHPQNASCPSVDVDYIRKPEVVIDVTDDVRDLNLFYSETLLNRLTDEAVKMFYQEVRDPNQYQIADREMLDNP